MKYLVTGGCGFLGSNLADEIITRKEQLIIFDNLSRIGTDNNLKLLKLRGNFKFIKGDIRRTGEISKLVRLYKPDVVFHAAGQVAMTTSMINPKLDFDTNASGTFNLLNAIRRYSPNTAVIFSSTNKVYGDLEDIKIEEGEKRYTAIDYPNGFNEGLPFSPKTPYGVSKATADMCMCDFYSTFGIQTVVFRHSSMYGGFQHPTYDQGWVGWFCQKAIEIKKGLINSFTISGNGKQVRDVLHAKDVVNLYFNAVEKINKCAGNVFNIGGGVENSLSLLELFDFLESELKIKLSFKQLKPRKSDQKVFIADNSKVKKMLGWQPKIDKVTGIRNTLKWINNNILD